MSGTLTAPHIITCNKKGCTMEMKQKLMNSVELSDQLAYLAYLAKIIPQRGTVYYLARKKPNGKQQSCTQSFLMHKDDFEEIGGYDEDFSGHYGHDDNLFNDMVKKRFNIKHLDTAVMDLSDIASAEGNRELDHNLNLYRQKKNLTKNEGERLRFNYELY
jgi:hypothetical protein